MMERKYPERCSGILTWICLILVFATSVYPWSPGQNLQKSIFKFFAEFDNKFVPRLSHEERDKV